MTKQALSVQHIDSSSSQPAYIFALFDAEIGPARVLVPDGAIVEYFVHLPRYYRAPKRYVLAVWINNQFAGWHCGDRSGDLISFERKSDADRLAAVRNAAYSLHASTPARQESEVA